MCPGGEIGRRTGLKILGPLKSCGFKSRPGHKKKPHSSECGFSVLFELPTI